MKRFVFIVLLASPFLFANTCTEKTKEVDKLTLDIKRMDVKAFKAETELLKKYLKWRIRFLNMALRVKKQDVSGCLNSK